MELCNAEEFSAHSLLGLYTCLLNREKSMFGKFLELLDFKRGDIKSTLKCFFFSFFSFLLRISFMENFCIGSQQERCAFKIALIKI